MNSFVLFAFGDGPVVVALVLACFALLGLIASLPILAIWALVQAVSGIFKYSWKAYLCAGLTGALASPLYMWAYGESFEFWLTPAIIGSFVMTNAVLLAAYLLQQDRFAVESKMSSRLELRTALLLVALLTVILGTLAPAFGA